MRVHVYELHGGRRERLTDPLDYFIDHVKTVEVCKVLTNPEHIHQLLEKLWILQNKLGHLDI